MGGLSGGGIFTSAASRNEPERAYGELRFSCCGSISGPSSSEVELTSGQLSGCIEGEDDRGPAKLVCEKLWVDHDEDAGRALLPL